MAKGMGVIAMKTLCRGQLPQMSEEPDQMVKELLAYALSQSVTLAVVERTRPSRWNNWPRRSGTSCP